MSRLSAPLDPARDHVLGDGPHELVVYGDYECPFTRNAIAAAEGVRARVGEQVRFGFRHFPLLPRHEHARAAAQAAEAADRQGLFWAMHEALFRAQDDLSDLQAVAAGVPGLDLARWESDMADPAIARRVDEDLASARASGVTGTPRLFIDGRLHEGFYDTESLIDELLLGG